MTFYHTNGPLAWNVTVLLVRYKQHISYQWTVDCVNTVGVAVYTTFLFIFSFLFWKQAILNNLLNDGVILQVGSYLHVYVNGPVQMGIT